VIDDGVYFDTSKFASYADFARLDLADQEAGARVEFNPQKRNPSDFALWKFSPKNEQRDMEWESPWGKGFPGWHLECSAMAIDKLGETIDIHTGGIDHIPVHHTNEIAQSEAATGKTFANYWLHNNFLLVDGTKVSKSIGNTYTLNDLAEKGFTPDDFRMFVLQSHYRTESNFTFENIQAAQNRLNNWRAIAALQWQPVDIPSQTGVFTAAKQNILVALQNDLDTPAALIAAESALNMAENGVAEASNEAFIELLESIELLFGLTVRTNDINEEQKTLISERQAARDSKNWQKSDEIRDILKSQGIEIKDTPSGQTWFRM
jgi:cysteinyl-tRNA synthetase